MPIDDGSKTAGIGFCAGFVDIPVYDDSDEEYRRYAKEFKKTNRLGLGESFGIPYRSLVPNGADNLWVASRCVSCDVKVQGALRIQPAATVVGQAVGTAASLAIGRVASIRDFDTNALRARLHEAGGVLE